MAEAKAAGLTEEKCKIIKAFAASVSDDVTLPSSLQVNIETLKRTKACPRCYLKGAFLRGADLYGAKLIGADLRNANLRDANLQFARLKGANLMGADLQGVYLTGAMVAGAKLDGEGLSLAALRGAIGLEYVTVAKVTSKKKAKSAKQIIKKTPAQLTYNSGRF